MITPDEIKRQYKDEWVLVEVIDEDEKGIPTQVELIAHSKARDEIYEGHRSYGTIPESNDFNNYIRRRCNLKSVFICG